MKILNKFILGLVVISFSCSSQQNEKFYKDNHQELYNKNNKKDTIYIYFRHSKNEKMKKNLLEKPNTYNVYSFNFPKLKHHLKNFTVFYKFSGSLKRTSSGNFVEVEKIKKNKVFLKTIKNKTYTYNDFKNKKEIAYFFSYNRSKTVYLIDENENKNDKIYLRKVGFSSSFPMIQ